MLDLKQKLPEESLFHLAGLLTVTFPEERDSNGKLAWKKRILVQMQKCVSGISDCVMSVCYCSNTQLLPKLHYTVNAVV